MSIAPRLDPARESVSDHEQKQIALSYLLEAWSEARLDGVDTRKQALNVLRLKATELGAGQWVYNLGGWSYDQFKTSGNRNRP